MKRWRERERQRYWVTYWSGWERMEWKKGEREKRDATAMNRESDGERKRRRGKKEEGELGQPPLVEFVLYVCVSHTNQTCCIHSYPLVTTNTQNPKEGTN